MKAELLTVGTELLLGDILNTNAQYLAQELAALGITLHRQTVVGDHPQRLEDAMKMALQDADVVICTGGLGPTEDDLTKETAARLFGTKLEEDKEALRRIQEYFRKRQRSMTENNKKQALIPADCGKVLYNDHGTAPGIVLEKNGKMMILLPGPPGEMVPMFQEQVRPILAEKQDGVIYSEILRTIGVGESRMESMVQDLIDSQTNPTIAPYAKDGEAILRVTARAETKEAAKNLIAPIMAELEHRFGESAYAHGETDLQTVVSEMLISQKKTIAVAESCTGGMISSWLVEYPGISEVFLEGCVTYSCEAKMRRLGVKKETLAQYGAVSAQCAAEMAEGIAKTSGAEIGLATTGNAGPSPSESKEVGLVYVGLYHHGKTMTQALHLAGDRNKIRRDAALSALNWLRKELLHEKG